MNKIKNFIKNKLNKKIITAISCLILFCVLMGCVNNTKDEEEIANDPTPTIMSLAEDIVEEKSDFEKFVFSIENTKEIKSSKIFSQTKYLSAINTEGNRDELLKYSVSTNYDTKNGNNLRGFFTFEMPMFSINTRFPLIVNKFMTNGYKVYVDIPNSYKPIFNMTEEQRYLFFDKVTMDGISKEYKLDESNMEFNLDTNLEEISNISSEIINESSSIYKFEFNKDETILFYKNLEKDDSIASFIIRDLLKREGAINEIKSFKGEAGVTKDILTDIYFEILLEDDSLIATRLTFENINDGTISIENFEDNNIKNLKDFIKSLDVNINFDKLNQEEHVITINDIFFTGEDETKILNFDEPMENLSIINIFINFVDCTPQTRLVIKWFYEDQEVPLIETKISNGDFIEGVLKSSISFEDESQIQKGKYNIKIYIDGNEEAVYDNSFEIK